MFFFKLQRHFASALGTRVSRAGNAGCPEPFDLVRINSDTACKNAAVQRRSGSNFLLSRLVSVEHSTRDVVGNDVECERYLATARREAIGGFEALISWSISSHVQLAHSAFCGSGSSAAD